MPCFVLAACGDQHVHKANLAVRALKSFTNIEIVVVAARNNVPVVHDQVISVRPPAALTDAQASRYLKTSLPHILGRLEHVHCYLDNDVLCVSPEATAIFRHRQGPITFAPDHQSNMWQHARTAMKTPVPRGGGPQLAVALRERFGVEIDPHWNLWNGGVFLFDNESRPFMENWHNWTQRLFNDAELHPRDQGALAATIWKFGLQRQATLPIEFNWIMGCTLGYHYKLSFVDGRFRYQNYVPKFLHFICDRVNRWEYRKVLDLLDGHTDKPVTTA